MSGSDYLPPDDMSLDAAGAALAVQLPVREHGAREIERTYYDTFDGLVRSAGLSVPMSSTSGMARRGWMPAAAV